MVWLYKRANEELNVESRLDQNTFEFVVTQRFTNGLSESERFDTFERCQARLIALDHRLQTDSWTNSGLPLSAPMGAEIGPASSDGVLEWLDPLRDPRWASFVAETPGSSVFQTCEWLGALQHEYAYEPIALGVSDRHTGALRSALVLCRIETSLRQRTLVSLPFSDHCSLLAESADDRALLLTTLRDEQRSGRWHSVELRMPGPISGIEPAFSASQRYFLHTLDLSGGPDSVMARFHKNHVRRKIRRSEREGLRCVEGHDRELLTAFYTLLVRTRRRHGLPPQPLEWFEAILSGLKGRAAIRVAYKGTTPVAAVVTLAHRGTVTYKYGASDETWHSLGGMQLLLWKTIEDASARGFSELDMGRSSIDQFGLVAFKDHWGTTRENLTYVTCPRPSPIRAGLTRATLGVARWVLSHSPGTALVRLGRAFYHHAG
jgi:CelD/BcsL family acetyltransferase involved in cellulose biosynthesis